MSRVQVTGGAGFIGSHLVRHLLRRRPGWSVTVLDRLTYAGRLDNLSDVASHARLRFVEGDVAERGVLDPLFASGIDMVFNLAAETHVDRSIAGPEAFLHTDVLGVFALLEAARRRPPRRFIQVSTDEVYGSAARGAFAEDAPLRPSSPYAASKASGDALAHAWRATYGVPTLVTRSSNNYGPRQHPEKLIPRLILCALANRRLPLYGDGRQVRDWLHVEDHCRALLRVAERGRVGGIYNIGSGAGRSNLQVARAVLAELGKPRSLIGRVADRPGHDRRYALDCRRMRALGWRPRLRFAEGLRATVNWYVRSRPWWEPLYRPAGSPAARRRSRRRGWSGSICSERRNSRAARSG